VNMSAKRDRKKVGAKPKMETCPACGAEYDPRDHQLLECPVCGKEGSTACCLALGRGCPCLECEEKE